MPRPSSKSLKHDFNDHYDDSSDEESVQEHIHHYDISHAWQKFISQTEKDSNDNLLSFVAHAAGIKFLYSNDINKLYYKNKSHFLKNAEQRPKASKQLEDILTRAILNSLNRILIKLQEFLLQADPGLHRRNEKKRIYQTILEECKMQLPTLIKKHAPAFISALKANRFTNKEEVQFLDQVKLDIIDLLSTHFFSHIPIPDTKHNRALIKQKIFITASKKIVKIIDKLNIKDLMNKQGSLQACTTLENYKGKYQHLVTLIARILKTSPARGYIEKIITKNIVTSNNKEQIIFAFIADLLAIKNRDQAKQKLLDNYFSLNKTNLVDILTSYSDVYLQEGLLVALKSLERPVLSKLFEFSSRNPFEFYANLRLSNRSQKRQILNLQHADRQDTVARLWSMSDTHKTSVLEMQTILKKSLGRKDIVEDLGNYTKIYDNIKHLQTQFPQEQLTDKKLAQGIRDIFNNHPPMLSDDPHIDGELNIKLHGLTYLLFGCEVARNPAMLIVNQMLVDLIINECHWNFKKAFVVEEKPLNCMPMAPEGAVAIARSLEADYRSYMPYTYFYRGVIEDTKSNLNKNDLVSLESKIISDWLKYYKKIKDISKLTPADLLSHIEAEFTNWFSHTSENTMQYRQRY